MTFKEYKGLDLTEAGKVVLDRWKRTRAFEKSLELREGAPAFIFFEIRRRTMGGCKTRRRNRGRK